MEYTRNIRERIVHGSLMMVLAGLAIVGLAACGGEAATPASSASSGSSSSAAASDATATPAAAAGSSSSSSSPGGQKVDAKLAEWSITLGSADVSAGKVEFDVTNGGQFTHDFVVLDASGNPVGSTPKFKSSDGTKTLDVDLKAGTYKLICDIPGHADRGMKTEITVK